MKADHYEVKNTRWKKDEDGWYWVADLYLNGKFMGTIGNYGAIHERQKKKRKKKK